jgi:hypothetical protein
MVAPGAIRAIVHLAMHSTQMALNLTLTLVAVGIFVSRLSSSRD